MILALDLLLMKGKICVVYVCMSEPAIFSVCI